MRRFHCLLLSLAVLFALPLHAGETGSISGVVKDSQGGVLPGAVVHISGPALPGGRESTTTQNGAYLFTHLLPGVYKVEAAMAGLGKTAREVRVSVDVDAQVDFAISPSATEEVTVSAEAPVVDLKSTEVNFNYDAQLIKELPLQRTYAGLFDE